MSRPPGRHSLEPRPLRLWLFRVFGLSPVDPRDFWRAFRVFVAATGWSVGWYALGALVSFLFGFGDLYLSTPVFVQTAALLVVMIVDVYWVAVTFPLKISPALECFNNPAAVEAEVRAILRPFGGWTVALVGFVIMALLALLFGVFPRETALLFGRFFDDPWFAEPRIPKFALGLLWSIPVGSVLWTGIVGLPLLWVAIANLASRELVERPVFVMPRLRHVVLFAQFTALAWSSPLLIFYTMTFGKAGILASPFVAAALAMGLFTLLQPHIVFHFGLQRMEASLTARISAEADDVLRSAHLDASDRLRVLDAVASDRSITWLYDLRVLASFALGPLIPAFVGFLGQR